MHRIREILDQIKNIGALERKKTVFIIANTAKIEDMDFFMIPVRNYRQAVVSGVIVFSEVMARTVAKSIDGLVDYIFVDAEKKIPDRYSEFGVMANIERAVKDVVKKSIFISYKANDLTVDAADAFISEYFSNLSSGVGGKKVAIIGAGNIGSKLALKLVERGADVILFRRNIDRLKLSVDYINSIKSKYTLAKARISNSTSEACNGVDVIIGATNGTPVIDSEVINCVADNALIIDIGKGSISKDAIHRSELCGISIYRLSVESALEGLIVSLISTHKTLSEKTGRRLYHGIKVVSGGLIARSDEIVVDDCGNPRYVYGIGDGCGDFNRNPNKNSLDKIQSLRKILQNLD